MLKATQVSCDDEMDRYMEAAARVADDPDAEPHPDYVRLGLKYAAVQGALVGLSNGGPAMIQVDREFMAAASGTKNHPGRNEK